jgi:hypothetical protein
MRVTLAALVLIGHFALTLIGHFGHFGHLGLFAFSAFRTPPARIFGHAPIVCFGSWLRTSFGATRGPPAVVTESPFGRVLRTMLFHLKLLLASRTFDQTFDCLAHSAYELAFATRV